MNDLTGLMDEYESADLAVVALFEAETRATRFERPGIARALNEAIRARASLALEIMDRMNASLKEAA